MNITEKEWVNYIDLLSKTSNKAGALMKEYIEKNGVEDRKALIDFAYGLVTKYGEGNAAIAAQMYDAIAALENRLVELAEVADTATYGEVAKTVNGVLKQSMNEEMLSGAIVRLVKRAGQDTTLQNAIRDGAEFAWIPHGDTCAFCIALASRGWQYASKNVLKNGHAEHIHGNCDCAYAIRFNDDTNYSSYDPEEYLDQYQSAEGRTPEQKINAMRRRYYQENKEEINEQKRSAYEKRKELNDSQAEEMNVD